MSNPVSPVISGFEDREVVYAKDQPEYRQLPVLRSSDGIVLSRWSLTDEERKAVAAGADIFLSVWIFNQPLQPVMVEVPTCGLDVSNIVGRMGL